MRQPTNTASLNLLKTLLKVKIDFVIDVGVQYSTPFLMSELPEAFHYLIEPVQLYHESIITNYSKSFISHELIKAAASDYEGVLNQHLQSLDGSGKITHSQLLPEVVTSLDGLVEIVKTPVITLDTAFANLQNYIVKIDVDGIEEKIIEGGTRTVSNALVVFLESPVSKLSSRVRLLESLGMRLFDITDICYYHNQLQQVDLVFVNNRVVSSDLDFHPFKKFESIDWTAWTKLS
jgi:FkbM family methyltransferase